MITRMLSHGEYKVNSLLLLHFLLFGKMSLENMQFFLEPPSIKVKIVLSLACQNCISVIFTFALEGS